jgi:hypothetical protein
MGQLTIMWEGFLPGKGTWDAKRSRVSGDTSTKLSSGKTTIAELSNNDIGSSVPKKKKKRHS